MIDPLLERVMAADAEMLGHLGIEVTEASADLVVLRGNPNRALRNSFDVVHGSHVFALMDTAAAYALASRGIHAATIGAHVTFSRPVVAGSDIMATATVMTAGRTLATVRGDVKADGRIASVATFQFAVRPPQV